MNPTYLYVFGQSGGPFKIGYSNNPKLRAKAICYYTPGSYFAPKGGIMWCKISLPDREMAKKAETLVHNILQEHMVRTPRNHATAPPWPWRPIDDYETGWVFLAGRTEWFDVPLDLAIKIVHECVENVMEIKPHA